MARVEIENLLHKIKEQADKRQYLNAMVWCIELQRWLLGEYNDIIKAARTDGDEIE